MNIEIINTGYFYADGGAMFGAIPKTAWSRRYPCNETNGCVLVTRSLLISTDTGKTILVDTGAGNKHRRLLGSYNFFDTVDLGDELRKRGTAPEKITDVILTHLHFDHCGYITQKEQPTGNLYASFANARHWVSRKQWDNFLLPNPLEKDSYLTEDMQLIADKGLLHLIDTDTDVYPDIHLRLFDGHTPGQIVPTIQTSGRTYVFAGDVIPLVASLSPEWISAYDTYPVDSFREKVRLLEEAAIEKQVLIYCHDAYTPYSLCKKVKDYYTKVLLPTLN